MTATPQNAERRLLRTRFHNACTDALYIADHLHPLRAAQLIYGIPADLAAHGFDVSMHHGKEDWHVTLKGNEGSLSVAASGTGSSLRRALRSLVGSINLQLNTGESTDAAPLSATFETDNVTVFPQKAIERVDATTGEIA